MVKSQTSKDFTRWYFFKGDPFVDYACCSCEFALRGNFCKHQIAILLKFLPDCRPSSILEYCGTYYGTERGGLKALCLYSKSLDITDFEEELKEDIKISSEAETKDNIDVREDFPLEPTQEFMSMKMQQLLQGIQEESLAGGSILMQHTNAILEKLYTDVKHIRSSKALESLHPHMHFEGRTDITNKSIERHRDYMELYMQRKKKSLGKKFFLQPPQCLQVVQILDG